jgi:hypothetical protein
LRTTENHPFYIATHGLWVEAQHLTPGDSLLTLSGKTVFLEHIEDEYGEFKVFNLDVQGNHNYYASGVLVHNCDVERRRNIRARELHQKPVQNMVPNPGGAKGEIQGQLPKAKVPDSAVSKIGVDNPANLERTHRLEPNRLRRVREMIQRDGGIRETIKYVEHEGRRFIVDGNHRVRAARELGIQEVPVERVELPYRGYRTVDDLLNRW